MSKSTLLSLHVMPPEFLMFERWINSYRKALIHLKRSNDIILKVTLNLNPTIINWPQTPLTQEYFIHKFHQLLLGIPHIGEIIVDDSCGGVTHQRRESIRLNYDQHIFADADVAFPETLLMHLLNQSSSLSGRYIVTPSVVRLWDTSWDPLVHRDFKEKPLGYHLTHPAEVTRYQTILAVRRTLIDTIKYSGGWFTLYSKDFFDFTGIPESLGGYGAEDEFGGFASLLAKENGCEISQFILDGIYVSEIYLNREAEKTKEVSLFEFDKKLIRQKLVPCIEEELRKFSIRSLGKEICAKLYGYPI
jgi:hypothetical protein